MLATGLMVAYGYVMELFMAWYSANPYRAVRASEPDVRAVRGTLLDSTWPATWLVVQLLWFRGVRRKPLAAVRHRRVLVNVGMWTERFVIVVTSLHRDFLPSSWGIYYADGLGLGDAARHARAVLVPAVPLHPRAANDLGPRDAHASSTSAGQQGTPT